MLRLVQVQQSLLRKNSTLAHDLRDRFAQNGTYVINLLSSPGAGKTTLLEETLRRLSAPRALNRPLRVAAIVGDQATENDAERLSRSGAPVKQIVTGAECRLDAQMITKALADAPSAADAPAACHPEPRRDGDALSKDREALAERPRASEASRGAESGFENLDFLAIENVGNLICPAEYDLGEDLRVVLFSVTEGEDKPLKYPLAFITAHLAIISKIDLANAVGFDRESAYANIERVHPGLPIMELATPANIGPQRIGVGFDEWIDFLETRITEKARPATVAEQETVALEPA